MKFAKVVATALCCCLSLALVAPVRSFAFAAYDADGVDITEHVISATLTITITPDRFEDYGIVIIGGDGQVVPPEHVISIEIIRHLK